MTPETYFSTISKLDLRSYRAGVEHPGLVRARSGSLTVEYAPFDHIEDGAELVIVGLTPGRQQAANALESLASELKIGTPTKLALERAKRTASFSGPMRANLIAMLDEIGVSALYGRASAGELFSDRESRVHFTSALRYPVYLGGKNYSGSPNPFSEPILKRMVESHLGEEVERLQAATWVPLGQHAEAALLHLASRGHLPRANILVGLPHPSGANAERIAYFLGRKDRSSLSAKTNPAKIDEAKQRLVNQIKGHRR